jgi:hypothetical protein
MIEPGLSPEATSDFDGVDTSRLPPNLLVAGAMHRAMVGAAQRNGEFIAHLAAERPRLQVAKMVRMRLFAAADEARLLRDITKVLSVPIAPRCSDCEHALVDAVGLITSGTGSWRLLLRQLSGRESSALCPHAVGRFGRLNVDLTCRPMGR